MKAVVFLIAVILAGCIAGPAQAESKPQDPEALYRTKCTACHRLYQARKHTYEKLETYVTRYGRALSGEERRRLLDYFKENSKK